MTDIARERVLLAAEGLPIVYREAWAAEQSYLSDRAVNEPALGFFLHISVTIDGGNTGLTEADDMRDIEAIGQQRFGIGFPYNAAAFDTGVLYEGQPLSRRGAHTVNDKGTPGYVETGSSGSLNYNYRALCLPQMVTDDVTDAQIDVAAKWAAAQIRAELAVPGARWSGHRDVSAKSCPGDAGYARLPELNRLTTHYVAVGLAPEPEPPDEVEIDPMRDYLIRTSGATRYFLRGEFMFYLPTSDDVKSVAASVGEDGILDVSDRFLAVLRSQYTVVNQPA